MILDVNGYFAPPGTGGLSLYTGTPCRVIDRRGHSQSFLGPSSRALKAVPVRAASTAAAYLLNATVVLTGGFP